jgi:hypothetical protein
MNWTILGSVLGSVALICGTWLAANGAGRREGCVKRFAKIEGEASTAKAMTLAVKEQFNVRLTEVDRRLESIEDELKGIRGTIEKVWLNMSKRKENHDD